MAAQKKDDLYSKLHQLKQENISLQAANIKAISELNNALAGQKITEEKYRKLFSEAPVSI